MNETIGKLVIEPTQLYNAIVNYFENESNLFPPRMRMVKGDAAVKTEADTFESLTKKQSELEADIALTERELEAARYNAYSELFQLHIEQRETNFGNYVEYLRTCENCDVWQINDTGH